MIVTTGSDVAGLDMVEYLGIVVRAPMRHIGRVGKARTDHRVKDRVVRPGCEVARAEVNERMVQHAREIGADAVIAMRYDSTDFRKGVTEVLAYGNRREVVAPLPRLGGEIESGHQRHDLLHSGPDSGGRSDGGVHSRGVARQDGDVAIAYVSLVGDGFCEAVTAMFVQQPSDFRIRDRARANHPACGASDPAHVPGVRKPRPDESAS